MFSERQCHLDTNGQPKDIFSSLAAPSGIWKCGGSGMSAAARCDTLQRYMHPLHMARAMSDLFTFITCRHRVDGGIASHLQYQLQLV